jgi:oligopeptide/dipeptide ABC transporter ATP-binding protein
MLLSLENVRKEYAVRRGLLQRKVGYVKAVDGVSLQVRGGTTFGVLGESGCGKSTLSRMILGLDSPTAGRVLFKGTDVNGLGRKHLKALRREVQPVFQDPYGALPPRMRINRILEEPYRIHGLSGSRSVAELLEIVRLPSEMAWRYPHELSGGQRQRVVIARALALNPSLVVCDEAVSALDVSVQSKILSLLVSLQNELGLTYVFISHDLGVVHYISDDLAVMYLGDVVERGPTSAIYADALHPYTWTLLWSMPSVRQGAEQRRAHLRIKGEQPSPLNLPSGCKFRTRCPLATERCKNERPPLREISAGRWAACHYAEEVPERMRALGGEGSSDTEDRRC